jgi:hypothetical protein
MKCDPVTPWAVNDIAIIRYKRDSQFLHAALKTKSSISLVFRVIVNSNTVDNGCCRCAYLARARKEMGDDVIILV